MNSSPPSFLLEYIEYGKVQKDFDTTDFCILAYSSEKIKKESGTLCSAFLSWLSLPRYDDTSFFSQTGNLTVALLKKKLENGEFDYLLCQVQSRNEGERARSLGNTPRISRVYEQIRFVYFTQKDVDDFILSNIQADKAPYLDLFYQDEGRFLLRNYLETNSESPIPITCTTNLQLSLASVKKARQLIEFILSQKKHTSWRVRAIDSTLNWEEKLQIIMYVQRYLQLFYGTFSFSLDYISNWSLINLFFYPEESAEVDKDVPEIDLCQTNVGELPLFGLLNDFLKEVNIEQYDLIFSLWKDLDGLDFSEFLTIARDFIAFTLKKEPENRKNNTNDASALINQWLKEEAGRENIFYVVWHKNPDYLLMRVYRENLHFLFQKLVRVYDKKPRDVIKLVIDFALLNPDMAQFLVDSLDTPWAVFEKLTFHLDEQRKQLAPFYLALFNKVIDDADNNKDKVDKILGDMLGEIFQYADESFVLYGKLFDLAIKYGNIEQISKIYQTFVQQRSSLKVDEDKLSEQLKESQLHYLCNPSKSENFYSFYTHLTREDKYDILFNLIQKSDMEIYWVGYIYTNDSIQISEQDKLVDWILPRLSVGEIDMLILQSPIKEIQRLFVLLEKLLNKHVLSAFHDEILMKGLVKKYLTLLPDGESDYNRLFEEYKKECQKLVKKRHKRTYKYVENIKKIRLMTPVIGWPILKTFKFTKDDFLAICQLCEATIAPKTGQEIDNEIEQIKQNLSQDAFTAAKKVFKCKTKDKNIPAARSETTMAESGSKQRRETSIPLIKAFSLLSALLSFIFGFLFVSFLDLKCGYFFAFFLMTLLLSLVLLILKDIKPPKK